MNTGQSNQEHNVRVIDSILNVLAKRFHIANSTSDNSQSTSDHLTKLSGPIGYLAQVSNASTKTWKLEERLTILEEDKDNPISKQVREQYKFNPDIMLTVIRDEKTGKLLN